MIYIVVNTWPLCSAQILVDGVKPQESYFQKSTNISAIVRQTSVSFVSLRSSRVHLQNNTFILRKIVANLCDMAYQKYSKMVISKEISLHYVTQSLKNDIFANVIALISKVLSPFTWGLSCFSQPVQW